MKDRRLSVLRHSEQTHCRLIGHCNPLDVYHEFSNQSRDRRSGLGSPQIEHTVSPLALFMRTFHSPFVVRIGLSHLPLAATLVQILQNVLQQRVAHRGRKRALDGDANLRV